jgi:hypothetical protein
MLDELLYVSPPAVSNSQHKSKWEQSNSLQFPKHTHQAVIWLYSAQPKLTYEDNIYGLNVDALSFKDICDRSITFKSKISTLV